MPFNDRDYTREAIIKQLGLIELHGKDGSAVEGGCECIEGKHLYLLEGLAEEGMGFAMSETERKFYAGVANFARQLRKNIEAGDFKLPTGHSVTGNPRKYLPYGLTACEKRYKSVRKKLSRCIKTLEPREAAGEIESAVAVCRASIKCPP